MKKRYLSTGIAGFVGGVAYVASCSTPNMLLGGGGGNPGNVSADEVSFAQAHSGLKATTVQQAIDEIGTTARAASSPKKMASLEESGLVRSAFGDEGTVTTWSMKLESMNPTTGAVDTVDYNTITLTEGATPGAGTYATASDNILCDFGNTPDKLAETTGKYALIGNHRIAFTCLLKDASAPVNAGYLSLEVADAGATMLLEFGGSGNLVLSKQ